MAKLKNCLKRFCPPPFNAVARMLNELRQVLLSALSKDKKEYRQLLSESTAALRKECQIITEEKSAALRKEIQQSTTRLEKQLTELLEAANRQNETLKAQVALLEKEKATLETVLSTARRTYRFSRENNWSDVFHDATQNAQWLENREFYPGRWAIGYQVMYVLFRLLNEVQPKKILELGLGQSTRLISQYVTATPGVEHFVVEGNEFWIQAFLRNTSVCDRTHIISKKVRTDGTLNGKDNIICYEDFEKDILPQKYNLILIDAPHGGAMLDYSRIDVAKQIPGCLADSFVIMVDDFNRVGEQHTVDYIKNVLTENSIPFAFAKYEGEKDLAVLTSLNMEYITTL